MIFVNKKLKKTINIFSNGSLYLSFIHNDLNHLKSLNFLEKDIKSFETKFKAQLNKNKISTPTKLIGYRKKVFK